MTSREPHQLQSSHRKSTCDSPAHTPGASPDPKSTKGGGERSRHGASSVNKNTNQSHVHGNGSAPLCHLVAWPKPPSLFCCISVQRGGRTGSLARSDAIPPYLT